MNTFATADTSKLLEELLKDGQMVLLYRKGNDYQVQAGPLAVCRSSLWEAMLELIHGAEIKQCARCGQRKPKTQFPRDASRADGLCPRCCDCERLRWNEVKKKGKAPPATLDPERN